MKITEQFLNETKTLFEQDRANLIAQRAAGNNGIIEASINRFEDNTNRHQFNINLEETEIHDQKKSGRCWMFAALNVMEYKLCKKYNIKTFELSQNYSLFYDKLERSNYFLNAIKHTFSLELTDRVLAHLLTDPLGDGGQWDMFKNLIKKYGVVPKYSMPETENSSNTENLNRYLTKLLRMYAKDLRNEYESFKNMEKIEDMIKEFMNNIYRVLCIALGTPPKLIDFEVYDNDKKFISEKNITPQAFFKEFISMNTDDYIPLISAPTKDKPYYKSYTVEFLGNVVEADEVKYVNVPIDVMKKSVIQQLKDDEPVWFGCDVIQFFDRKGSRLDLDTVKVDQLFSIDYNFSKEERLDYKESLMTHAMVFMGVDYDETLQKANRYKVENSWGKESGNKGYLVMSDNWFDEYMYQVLINKKHLDDEIIKAYQQEAVRLKPWDPMGSLATVK